MTKAELMLSTDPLAHRAKLSPSTLALFGYAVLVIFGWWIPIDVLDHSPRLRAFADVMASTIPQIERAAALGGRSAGQTNQLLYSVLWIVVITTMPFFVIDRYRHIRDHDFGLDYQKISLWLAVVMVVFGVLGALDIFFLYWFDPSLRLVHFGIANRFGAALMAPLLAYAPAVFLCSSCFLCWGLITGRIAIGR